ncbi:hypothetical protein C9374_008521 [Naegleria lovaniensis]|uniref:FAD-binding PCMH-type domain-containing protein n=1 Tax=Naegleria lovaniensis TaxID=51637 RepID=A0AA88GH08_NAELO|nr:uncharacterized protein C9374_008521 [Naegleria lovaniensis]KAG2378378.1 hypothetical protein C9374_008521 [Naegleria lovaniensis]
MKCFSKILIGTVHKNTKAHLPRHGTHFVPSLASSAYSLKRFHFCNLNNNQSSSNTSIHTTNTQALDSSKTCPNLLKRIHWVNDVGGMNRTRVQHIHYPLDEWDIQNVVKIANLEKSSICIRGQNQTMGGQTLFPNAHRIDMERMNRILELDLDNETVTVQTGLTWDELMHFLDQFGYSPAILQSYVTFSVGGSISVDIHGITSHQSISSSILELHLVDSQGNFVKCNVQCNPELFQMAIGGFGLFGVIYVAKLKIVPNTKIDMKLNRFTEPEKFHNYYLETLEKENNSIQLARVNLVNGNIDFYEFPKIGNEKMSGCLNGPPREMSLLSQVIYKWVGDTRLFRNLRFNFLEKWLKHPLDWKAQSDRNSLLYESVKPVSSLFSPFVELNKTHVLQEYFIPKQHFLEWYPFMMKEIKQFCKLSKHSSLLNVTIRFVKKRNSHPSDLNLPILTYAKQDVYSFVFYYRADKNVEADHELETFHHVLSNKAAEFGGSFYLPYRHHYTLPQLLKSYPEFEQFVAMKKALDPNPVFNNLWFSNYSTLLEQFKARHGSVDCNVIPIPPNIVSDNPVSENLQPSHESGNPSNQNTKEPTHYSKLNRNKISERGLYDFLRYIFPVVNAQQLFDLVKGELDKNHINSSATSTTTTTNDRHIYELIQKHFRQGIISNISILFNAVKYNMSVLNKEMKHQLHDLLSSIGKRNEPFHGCMTLGDCGRFVKMMRREFHISGPIYICNDQERASDRIERSSMFPVGQFVSYPNMSQIPSQSLDLVTCFIGLHHYKDSELDEYMKHVNRVLRPGGIFILREHDAYNTNVDSMAHVAHNTFNALMGFSYEENSREFRHFRSMKEWNTICERYGLKQAGKYCIQKFDPTLDLMTCYVKCEQSSMHSESASATCHVTTTTVAASAKDSFQHSSNEIPNGLIQNPSSYLRSHSLTDYTIPEWFAVELVQKLGSFLNHTPWYDYPFLHVILQFWKLFYQAVKRVAKRDGLISALWNGYNVMNFVIGLVSTFLLSQMFVLSMIPKIVGRFSSNSTANLTHIQAVLRVRNSMNVNKPCELPNSVRILNSMVSNNNNYSKVQIEREGLRDESFEYYQVDVPRFLPFTTCMKELSRQFDVQVIEIAGQTSVNIKIVSAKKDLQIEEGIEAILIEKYQIVPNARDEDYVHIFSVVTRDLLKLLQQLEKDESIRHVQIHDF